MPIIYLTCGNKGCSKIQKELWMIDGRSLTVHGKKDVVMGINRGCGSHTMQGKDSASWQ
jgi:hypothetical protein